MKDIKTKPVSNAPKKRSDAARLPKTVKAISTRSKDSLEETDTRDEHSPEGYATDQTYQGASETAGYGIHVIGSTLKRLAKDIKAKQKQNNTFKETAKDITGHQENQYPDHADYSPGRKGHGFKQKSSMHSENMAFVPPKDEVKSTFRTADKGIKSIQRSIKDSDRTIKTSAQAAKATAKSAKAAAKSARISAQAVKNAARGAVKGVRLLAKASVAAIKAAALAVKSVAAAIAAGGWVVLLIVLIVGALSMILSSAFGIFYSNEPASASAITMSQVVNEINGDFESYISSRAAKASEGHDNVTVIYDGDSDGDSDSINNWADVLGIYAVKTTMDANAPMHVAILTEENMKAIHDLFFEMNKVSTKTETKTETKTVTDEDGVEHEETIEKTYVYVTVSSMDSQDAAAKYHFSDEQNITLDELMSPENYPLFAEITGVDVYGGIPPEDIRKIIRNLPLGTKGTAIVQAALTRLGDPYSMAKRGQGRYVDCSYFVRWAYNEAGVDNYKAATAAEQARYCVNHNAIIPKDQLQPGDVVFWKKNSCTCAGDHCGRYMGIHHVAIYIGYGKLIEASSSKGRVVIRNIWGEGPGKWQIILYARPHVIN
jgi:cell wall-associated NlpC family hydrolase